MKKLELLNVLIPRSDDDDLPPGAFRAVTTDSASDLVDEIGVSNRSKFLAWAGHAHRYRHSEAIVNRPRGGTPRRINRHINDMDLNKEVDKTLPSQGDRNPSGRRVSPTVSGTHLFLSCVGPTPLLATGVEGKFATVETRIL